MNLRPLEFVDFLKDNLADVMIGVGIPFVVFGVFMLSTIGSVASAVGLFCGSLLIVYGLMIRVGLFSVKWRSMNGVGTILLCISFGLFALAVVSVQFQDISFAGAVREAFEGSFTSYSRLLVHTNRPFLYLFVAGFQLGLVFFVLSIIAKVYALLRG